MFHVGTLQVYSSEGNCRWILACQIHFEKQKIAFPIKPDLFVDTLVDWLLSSDGHKYRNHVGFQITVDETKIYPQILWARIRFQMVMLTGGET